MPKFLVEIIYEPDLSWTEEDSHYFDPPRNKNDPTDKQRVYKTTINARNRTDACKKVIESRREAQVQQRIYDWKVISKRATLYP